MEEINALMDKCHLRNPPTKDNLFDENIPFPESSITIGEMGVSIAKPIANDLKEHQIEGVRFMFNNICSDLDRQTMNKEPSGCILVRFCLLTLIHNFIYFTQFKKGALYGPRYDKLFDLMREQTYWNRVQ